MSLTDIRTESVEGYRLSGQQRHLWTVGSPSAQTYVRITGPLDPRRLEAALHALVDRHEVLRTTYGRVSGRHVGVQVVHDDGRAVTDWQTRDLAALGPAEQGRQIEAAATAARASAPPEGRGPVVRAVLFALGPAAHGLLLTLPGLAADRDTLRLITAELARRSAVALASTSDDDGPEVLQYVQFAEWQHALSEGGSAGRADDGAAGASAGRGFTFPLDRGGPESDGDRVTVRLALPVHAAAHAYAESRRIRLESVLLAGWQVLLWRVTGQAAGTVVTLFGGRSYEELRACLGPVERWIGVAASLSAQLSFDALAAATDDAWTRIEEHAVHVFAGPGAGADPRGSVAFECRSRPQPQRVGALEFIVAWERVAVPNGADLTLECATGPDEPTETDSSELALHGRGGRFDEDYLRCLAGQYAVLVGDLVGAGEAPIGRARLLDAPAREELLAGARGPDRHDGNACVHQLVEEQALRTPDAVAVRGSSAALTYAELVKRADRLAVALRRRGVGPEVVVGVCLSYSEHLITGLLAVLKAGGAYVPLEPALPDQRLRDLVERAGCRVALVDSETAARLTGCPVEAVAVDGPPDESPIAPIRAGVGPDHLAYVMFTSGSTGAPKGVMVSHRAAVNYLLWTRDAYGTGGAGCLVHSSVAFDLTVTSIFQPLITGRTVRVDGTWQNVAALGRELARGADLSLLKLTPSHLAVVNRALDPASLAAVARTLIIGGEALTGDAVRPWREHAPGTRLFNEYGPTEAAVGCCVHEVRDLVPPDGPVPIGRPIPNMQVYVLDTELEPAPIGVVGEIYLGGAGLARGYRDAPDLSADCFVPDPFATTPGGRLYRTGDLACTRSSGEIVYLGRSDAQIKVHGVRVEPAEVRAELCRHAAVRDAAVVQLDDPARGLMLAAFVVTGGADPTGEELRSFLAARVPAYLMPDTILTLDVLPLTGNGKVDRDALSRLTTTIRPRAARTRPRDAVELGVVTIMEELLGTAPVGPDDDFFDLGGHSLLAVQLIARLNARFAAQLQLSVLFEDGPDGAGATAARLANLLRGHRSAEGLGCVVPLRAASGATALYCLHPADGEVFAYRELAAQLPSDWAVYGIQATPSPGETGPSVEDLAGRYADEIRAARPGGPYRLLGWSLGGVLAFAVAQRLHELGESVVGLVLVDSYPPGQLPHYNDTDIVAGFAEELGRLGVLNIDLGALAGLSYEDAVEAVLAGGPVADAADRAEFVRRLGAYRSHVLAVRDYQPGGYSGSLTIVQAGVESLGRRRGVAEAWRRLGDGSLHTIPADHFGILRGAPVAELAQIVETELADHDHDG